jgi:hypothetical protein
LKIYTRIWLEKGEEKDNLEILGVDGKILLKWIVRE